MTRTDEIEQLPSAANLRIARPLETQPRFAVFQVSSILHARSRVPKLAGNQRLRRWSAGVRHRSLHVTAIDALMTGGASLVSHVAARLRTGHSLLLLRKHPSTQPQK